MKGKFSKIVPWIVSLAVVFSVAGIIPVFTEADTITITTWDDMTAVRSKSYCKVLKVVQEEFEKTHPNIRVNRLPMPKGGEIRRALVTAMSGGTGPDAFNEAYGPSMPVWIEQGFCYPLDEYIKDWKYKDDVAETVWPAAMEKGHIYGAPHYIATMGLAYRKDLFKEAGLPMRAPKNWDELVQFAQRLTVPEKHQYGFGLLGQEWLSWYWENFVWQAGGEVTKMLPNGKVELSFTDPPAVFAAKFYQDLRNKYKCTQKNVLETYDNLRGDFLSGRAAMWMSNTTDTTGFVARGLPLDKFGYGTLPAGPTGIKASVIELTYWTINSSRDKAHRDATWEYIKFMIDPNTFIKRWKLQAKYGLSGLDIPAYKNIDMTDYVAIPEEWARTNGESLKWGHIEYIFKDKIEPYLAPPIENLLLDPKADPWTELVKCAKKVVAEIPNTVLAPSAK